MTNYAFQSKEVAEALSRVGKEAMRGVSSGIAPTGREHIYAKVPAEGIDGRSDTTCTSGVCTLVRFVTGELIEESDTNVEVYNVSETDLEAGSYIEVFRVGAFWVFDGGGGGGGAPKRVKFKLDGPLLKTGVLQSGFADATVIDPMNSGLAWNDTIVVYDYHKQFVMSNDGAIGIAFLDSLLDDPQRWHIEECEQLVNNVRAALNQSCAPWASGRTVTIDQALSSWPYVLWLSGELDSQVSYLNDARITAGTGYVNMRRDIPAAYLPDPSNTTCPYTLGPITPQWQLVSATRPTARWCQTITPESGDTNFTLVAGEGDTNYWEGFDPAEHDDISDGDIANPPDDIWSSMTEFRCHIKGGTIGNAYLDDNTGEYVTIATASGLFGLPEVVKMAAKLDATATDVLIEPKSSECGMFEYDSLTNVLVWGNPDTGGSDCKMTQEIPRPFVDVLENATESEVVTGVIINSNGDLEMERSTIKACESPGANQTIALTSMDVVNDVYCSSNLLTKDYSTIKFLGSTVSSSTGVDLPCTNPINYNWETLFNNYISNQSWYSISYYDINFPEGCFPCPTGCCTQTLYDGSTNQVYPLTDSDCTATVDPSPSQPTDVVSVSWSEGDCEEDCCSTLTVSQCDFGSPDTYTSGAGDIGFTQSSITDNGGCSWTINGTWNSNFNGASPSGSYSLTYDEASSTWSISGSIPSPYGGTISGSAVQDACTVQSGTVLDISITGTHLDFSGSTATYNGKVRISFTQTG